ncbi:MAG: DUF4333 domain-containing protein [Nocardioides sp.]
MRISRAAWAAPIAAVVLTLSGCSVSVAQSDLEKEVARGEAGVTDVECDGDLDGEVGATQDCTVTFDDDTTVDVEVEVTEVDGSDVSFDVNVLE